MKIFNWFKKKEKNFPELKSGDYVYFKEEDFWEEKGDNIGITRYRFGDAGIFLDPGRAYKIKYVNKNGDGYIVEVGDFFLHVYDEDRVMIQSIKKKKN